MEEGKWGLTNYVISCTKKNNNKNNNNKEITGFLPSNVWLFKEGNTTLNQLKRSFKKETFNELHSISLCSWKKKTLLEANNKKKIFQFLLVCCSVNHVNLCKFVASFPGVFAVSCTRICYKNLGKRCSVYVYVYSSFFSLFWAVHYNVPWKVYSPQDPVPQQLDSFSCSLIG